MYASELVSQFEGLFAGAGVVLTIEMGQRTWNTAEASSCAEPALG